MTYRPDSISATEPIPDTSEADLDRVVAAAASAFAGFGGVGLPADRTASPSDRADPVDRAGMLRGAAAALQGAEAELVQLAMAESHLPEARLKGELGRTCFQLRLFADVLQDGGYAEPIIDPADPDWPVGPRPDLRRMLVPIGPAAVFAASNFPFAFSVAGGDTAAALAAGCPVVVKAHPGHPELSARVAELVAAAFPPGVLGIVYGFDAGPALVKDPRIKVGAFTGSIPAGRALYDLAAARPDPIPFYAELGSLNPAFVTPAAVRERAEEIASGFVGSYTLGVGQFCTKPGLLFVPAGSGLVERITVEVGEIGPAPMLNGRIRAGYADVLEDLAGVPGVETLVVGSGGDAPDDPVTPTLLRTTTEVLTAHADRLLTECFGPTALVVEYSDPVELPDVAALFPGSLTAAVHGEPEDHDAIRPLLAVLAERAGRLLWNGWPTGVSVTGAMQHGGPWPATTASIHTSVGPTAIRRFLRPVSYQNMPSELLPATLR